MTQNKIPTDEEILAKAKQRYTEEVPCFSWQEDHSRYVLQALGEARAAGREEQRDWLLEILHSLCYCDHMGDVSNVMLDIQKRVGLEGVEWNEFGELADAIRAIRAQGEEEK